MLEMISCKPEADIQNVLARSRIKIVHDNGNSIYHNKRCIEFCGCQKLPLKNLRDLGSFALVAHDHNESVFKAALRPRLECAD